jgi:beta-galactosidase
MRRCNCLFVLFILFIPGLLFAQDVSETVLFNKGWKFHKGEVQQGQTNGLNDQQWRQLDLPHDWSIEGPFSSEWASSTGYLPAGIGWYRKSFKLLSKQWDRVFIYFDGVYKNSEVWINGHYLGKRPNGYIPFQYELSKYLNKNGNNVIAVKVDHTKFADSRWYPGSGIYRNVYLITKKPVYIPTWGVSFTTPQVNTEVAQASIAVQLENGLTRDAAITVKSQLLDPEGKIAGSVEQQLTVKKSNKADIKSTIRLSKPQLWSTDRPQLYRLIISVFADGKKMDEYSSLVGLRAIKFDADEGFLLNGKNLKLKGVCIHHDAGALGAAVPKEVWARRLRKLKEVGCNAIRMSHYPHQDYMYDLCDEMGFVVMDEAFDEWALGKNKWVEGWNEGKPVKDGYHEYFQEWADRDLRDMILRNRNHPSIVMWSIGNEIDYPNDPYTHKVLDSGRNPQIYGKGYTEGHPPASEMGDIARRLVKIVKLNDTTRPVTAALAGVVMSNYTDYPALLDLVGYNYQEYRYAEDHKKYPKRIIYGSENGKGAEEWLAVDSNKYIFGQFLWTGFDFVGEARKWPVRSSGAGLFDMAGFPKNDFYLRQSLWTTQPMTYLMAAKTEEKDNNRFLWNSHPSWNWSAGDRIKVRGITNTEEAELFLNGISLGRKKAGLKETLYWDVAYQPGELLIKGFRNQEEVTSYKLVTSGPAHIITAKSDLENFDAKREEVSHIEIQLADQNGNPVYHSNNNIDVKIEGPARLIGLESGDLASHESYQSAQRKAYRGKLLVYIRSNARAGLIKVSLSSPGLTSKSITYTSK